MQMQFMQRFLDRLDSFWPTASLRTYLVAVMLLATLPIAAIMSLQIFMEVRSEQVRIEDELARSAAALMQTVERELGSSLFLYTSDTTVMAVLLLDYYEGGNTGKTAAFSLIQTVILGGLLGITTWLSRDAAQGSARVG